MSRLLKESGNRWVFSNESVLEDFVWSNLSEILELDGLARQYRVNGEICDIVALDKDKRLVVIELKNSEDRGIIQQLTRYYANLVKTKPSFSGIGDERVIRLIAICPKFHRHSLIDVQYSQLDFELFEFELVQESAKLFLMLLEVGSEEAPIKIALPESWLSSDVRDLPEVPTLLKNILGKYPLENQEKILKLRERVLGFHDRIEETTLNGTVMYGRGRNRTCMELKVDRHSNQRLPSFYFYLPIPYRQRVKRQNPESIEVEYVHPVGRMLINLVNWSENPYQIVHIPSGKRRSAGHYTFDDLQAYLLKSALSLSPIEAIAELALQSWVERS